MTTRSLPLFLSSFLPKRVRREQTDILGLWRSRRALARLDSALLKDIGYGEIAADRESKRPLWDVPDHWRS